MGASTHSVFWLLPLLTPTPATNVPSVSYRRRNPTREARLFPSLLGKIEMGFPSAFRRSAKLSLNGEGWDGVPPYDTPGRASAQGRASSNAADAAITVLSSPKRPTTCSPIGSPSDERPHGTLAAGWPIMLIGYVNGV